MSLYEYAKRDCKFGRFDEDVKAGYTITDAKNIPSPWYYIYQNRKILLYVDQNGPVKIQYQPPMGILLIKREIGETQSKWQVWISCKEINGGNPVSNFNSPKLTIGGEEPKFTVKFSPTTATYISVYKNAIITTEIFVPSDKATVCMKTTIKNVSGKDLEFTVLPSVFPYINVAQMVAWDLPEWYLSVKPRRNGKCLTLTGQMSSPDMIKENERCVNFNMDYDENAEFTHDMSSLIGCGNFFRPDAIVYDKPLNRLMKEVESVPSFGSRQATFAAKYLIKLKDGEEKTFTEVMTVQNAFSYSEEENAFEQAYFDKESYNKLVENTKAFYDNLFGKRTIKTSNKLYDDFINYFTPLQMYWVCSLDRGWPSAMRGTRDACQDFVGMLPLDCEWTKSNMLGLLEHQRRDGWFPRQVSSISRTAPHDMRYFSDGGAFFLELAYEYLTFTRDKSFLEERVYWLDSDEKSTVLEHILQVVSFYLDKVNIGEHGLCKVWYGDWWDPMDKIGMDGIGETVTVTAQMIVNLENFVKVLRWLEKDEYNCLIEEYLSARRKFIDAMRKHAYNKSGFFNGYYNDNKKWLLSDNDPDGESRLYLVSNAWAIISGCTTREMNDSILKNVKEMSLNEFGYNTNSKGFAVHIDKAGRKGNGNQPNPATYNHAQSFLTRACCKAGYSEMAYDVTRYVLPIEDKYAPVELTFAPPYALANCYSCSKATPKRVGFQFLSGTVSYVLRNVYNSFFGINYELNGLTINPCMPSEFGDVEAKFEYLGKRFTVKYTNQYKNKTIEFNGKVLKELLIDEFKNAPYLYLKDEDMNSENVIIFS